MSISYLHAVRTGGRQIFPKTASENGIIFGINMSGELPMQGRRGAMVKYSAAYSTCAERFLLRGW